MENVVSIVNTRTNPLEWDISIQGVDSSDATVKFVIETSPVHFCFICHAIEDGKWGVDIPPLPHIDQVSYPFHIEIVVDGYYFEPYRGTLNVTAEPTVQASDVNRARPAAPVVSPVVQNIEVKEEDGTPDLDALAEKIINKNKNKPKPAKKEVVQKPTLEESKKDKLVRDAIEKFKTTPLKKKEVIEEEKVVEEIIEDKSAEPRKSNLAGAIEKLENPELSDQAKKVRDIIGN